MWRCWERWHMCWSHAGKPPASWHNIICRVIFYNTDGQSLCRCCTHFGDFTSSQCSLTFWRDECVCYLCDVAVTVSLCDVGGVTVWQSHCVMLVVWQCDSLLQWSHNVYTQCGPGRPGTLRPPLICVSGAVTGRSEGCPCTHSDTHHHTTHTHHHAGGHHRPRLHQGGQGGHCQSYHLHLCEQDPAVQGDNKQDRRGRECYLCNYGVVTSPQLGHTVTCDRLCLVPQSGDHSHSALWCVWVSRWDGLT